MTSDPDKFVENDEITRVLQEKGPEALPVVLLNDQVVKVGSYPTNGEFAKWFEVKPEALNEKPKARVSFGLEELK